MIKVCDSMMGSGKSSACINYMNEHPEQKFIYITPYTDESKRIRKACPKLRFVEPSEKNKDGGYSKSGHTAALIAEGRNITSTHQCFKYYTPNMLDSIRRGEYTLMIDENVEVLEACDDISPGDLETMMSAGHIVMLDDGIHLTEKEYHGVAFRRFVRLLKSRHLIENQAAGQKCFYWALPADLLMAFKEVVIMTYMFNGSDMYYYLRMQGLEYENIGVVHDERGYHFSNAVAGVQPPRDLKEKIHICQRRSRNSIGEDYHALSMHWFKKAESNLKKAKDGKSGDEDEQDEQDEQQQPELDSTAEQGPDAERLRKNLYNWFINDNRKQPEKKRLWATVGDSHGLLRTAGVWNNNLVFNSRATNNYADRTVLAYPVNVFVNVDKKKYYARQGIIFNEDRYALSTMIQWIWRSAIRNGEEIWIYIPSRRMRELLQGWLNGLASEEAAATPPAEGRCIA